MAKINLSNPNMDAGALSNEQAIQKIVSYLFQLNEQLRYELTHIDENNMTDAMKADSGINLSQIKKAVQEQLQGGTIDLSGNETIRQIREAMDVMQSTFNQTRASFQNTLNWHNNQINRLKDSVEQLDKRVKALEDVVPTHVRP